MNVYDFDGTIYDGDSTIDFYLFCLRKNPKIIIRIPGCMLAFIQYRVGKITKTRFKEIFFSFLKDMRSIDDLPVEFWDKNISKIKSWYLMVKKSDDLVITASPDFIVRPAIQKIGNNSLIASEVDPNSGKFLSKNCKGKEKVNRYLKEFPDSAIDNFFSDSVTDKYLAQLAKKSYFVKKNTFLDWNLDQTASL
ncbi:haloacid dehalogenase-like hydrolase [Butyrivibrio sp. INlla21]|uniref:haloacid dehalogenase-like hydrolase n=1 Tax=Butyrivibrio sp. INlla21 TaxID=1520811 RepID=UPI0008E7D3D6|nr:haloacid dehalogenase-like hydrolase [Butyrivibrio sp. INlla21]SFU98353.1 Phosphoserine phosphatase [Butyrivibrio sp. INlla21]